ncbi:hypothetical protein [Maribacter sp. IgM3_T14_3]|uniref:hypothetical protein n=1 Tax=Maribacter sp. IgM3_T14_3 TaxID=3415140 RepID=UPI003C6F7DB8
MMQPYTYREWKLLICPFCLEVDQIDNKVCSSCDCSLEFTIDNNIFRNCEAIMFYAYQQRKTLEKEIERTNGKGPYRHHSHIPYGEIFAFIIGAVASGMTWDAIKFLISKIFKSVQKLNIVVDDERMIKSGIKPDYDLLKSLATDNNTFEEFVKCIDNYAEGMPNVHPHIRDETRFVNLPNDLLNDKLLRQIVQTIEKEMNSKKSKLTIN